MFKLLLLLGILTSWACGCRNFDNTLIEVKTQNGKFFSQES